MLKRLFRKLRVEFSTLFSHEPEIQEDYVDKVVTLLRRDFTTTQQNEIVISVVKKLSELRQEDMDKMSIAYDTLQRDNNHLKQVILC